LRRPTSKGGEGREKGREGEGGKGMKEEREEKGGEMRPIFW